MLNLKIIFFFNYFEVRVLKISTCNDIANLSIVLYFYLSKYS